MLSVSGLRGIVGASLTPETVARFAGAVALWVKNSTGVAQPVVVLARDGRRGGHAVSQVAAGALAGAGCRVIDLGVATTPTAGVMVRHHGAHAGLVATASHNPGQWNGLKVIDSRGAAPPSAHASEVIRNFRAGYAAWAGADQVGSIERDEGAAAVHVHRVIAALTSVVSVEEIRARRFRVVLDSVNASGAVAGRMLLETLGCDVVHLNAQSTGVFPHAPEPTQENLADLCRRVSEARADAGFAQDPDADRLAMLDETGRYIGEEYTLALAAECLLSARSSAAGASGARGSNAVVTNLSTSRMVDDIARRHGATVIRSAVGEANVVSAMGDAELGGEGNGGVIWAPVVLIRDSLCAMALALALLTRRKQSLSAVCASIPSYAIVKRKVDLPPGSAGFTPAQAAAVERAFAGASVDRQDGVRLDMPAPALAGSPNGMAWVHVRASNTEPIVRLIAEAPSPAQASLLLDRAGDAIRGA